MDSDIKKPNEALRYEREKWGWSQRKIAEKLDTTEDKISRWERGERTPSPHYREKLCSLFGKSAEELGFIKAPEPQCSTPSMSTNTIKERSPNGNREAPVIVIVSNGNEISLQIPTVKAQFEDRLSQSSTEELGNTNMDRRDFIRNTTHAGIGLLFTPAHDLLSQELLKRCTRALKKSSTIDTDLLGYIYKRTDNYWQDRDNASVASYDLLGYALEHFEKTVALLEGSLLPAQRIQLCTVVGGTALLVGHLFYDLSKYARANEYYNIAITAAQEANNSTLQAVAWGRTTQVWIYSGNTQQAHAEEHYKVGLTCIQKARHLITQSTSTTVNAWLAAVEAEVQAKLGNRKACLMALDEAERIGNQQSPHEDSYWINFDQSLLAGYKGTCLQQLYRPQDPQTNHFVVDARQVLTDALSQLHPTLMRRQPIYLADIAGTFVRQREVEEACSQAIKALAITAQIKSQPVLQRVLTIRSQLEPWKDTQHVNNLDRHLAPILTAGWYRGNA